MLNLWIDARMDGHLPEFSLFSAMHPSGDIQVFIYNGEKLSPDWVGLKHSERQFVSGDTPPGMLTWCGLKNGKSFVREFKIQGKKIMVSEINQQMSAAKAAADLVLSMGRSKIWWRRVNSKPCGHRVDIGV